LEIFVHDRAEMNAVIERLKKIKDIQEVKHII
jgi:hypothetical protein